MSPGTPGSSSGHGSPRRRASSAILLAIVIAAVVVAVLVFVPTLGGDVDAPMLPTGVGQSGLATDDPTVSSDLEDALEELARREAAQRWCNAHPEAASTEKCTEGV